MNDNYGDDGGKPRFFLHSSFLDSRQLRMRKEIGAKAKVALQHTLRGRSLSF